jgi:hypothetical protein
VRVTSPGENAVSWDEQTLRLRRVQLELMRRAPYRDFGLIPGPSATDEALEQTETRLGYALPQSYRSFLARHDGWQRLYDGASLLGCAELGKHDHEKLAREIFASAASPSACSPESFRSPPRALLVFGLDRAGTTLFAFDLDNADDDMDPPVTAWIGELGLKFRNFAHFLQGIEGLCDAELAEFESLAPPASRREPVRESRDSSEPLRKSA